MAYTNTPQNNTYRTVRIDAVNDPTGRNGTATSDIRYVNIFPEKNTDPHSSYANRKFYLRERPGTVYKSGVTAGTARGMHYYNGHMYSVIDNQLYQDSTPVQTISNSTGPVGFTEYNGTYNALILLDGINGYVIKTDLTVTPIVPGAFAASTAYTLGQRVIPTAGQNGYFYEVTTAGTTGTEPVWPTTSGNTVTSGSVTFTCRDGDFPTPHIPYPVFIDGYLFVCLSNSADIYNSDLEDPLLWTAGNFITAELYPDNVVSMGKNNNYLVALGSQTIEHFYDAAIASGSPLQRNDTAVQQMGCIAPQTTVTTDDGVVFVGTTMNGGRTVWILNGFQPKEIGVPVVKQHLDSEGSNISNAVGMVFRTMGHKFYMITTTTRTFVYDFDEGMWHEWSYNNETTPWLYKVGCDHPDGQFRLLHPTNGNIVALSDTSAHDAIDNSTNTTIYAVLQTEKLDFGSINRKFGYRLSVIGDTPTSSNTPMTVQWSDDDYRTWSAARTLNINGDISFIMQLGMFRRRAFKFIYNQDYPLRLEGFEIDLNIGNS